MSGKVVGWVLDYARTESPGELLVLICIADQANHEGHNAFPSHRRMALRIRMSERQVYRLIKNLVDRGELGIERRGGGSSSNSYFFPRIDATPDTVTGAQTLHTPDIVVSPPPDTSDRGTPDIVVSPEPSLEPSKNRPLAASPSANGNGRKLSPEEHQERVALKDAIVEVCGWDRTVMTPRSWGRVEAAAKELHDAEADPGDLALFAAEWMERFPDGYITPQTIAGNWPSFFAGDLKVKRKVRR